MLPGKPVNRYNRLGIYGGVSPLFSGGHQPCR